MEPKIILSSSALLSNFEVIYSRASQTPIFPVVKANAYGLGADLVSNFLEKSISVQKLPKFCVARVREAAALRRSGVKRPIIVLSSFDSEEMDVWPLNTEVVCQSTDDIEALEKTNKKISGPRKIHLKLDAGMHRLGFLRDNLLKSLDKYFPRLQKLQIKIVGVMSHFSSADVDEETSRQQLKIFEEVVEAIRLKIQGSSLVDEGSMFEVHMANSDAIFKGHLGSCNRVRPGLALWGSSGSNQERESRKLKPVLTLKAPLRRVFLNKAGQGLGYGLEYKTHEDRVIGVVALGYADGLRREFSEPRFQGENSDRLFVSLKNHKVPVCGRVSMDLCFLDLTNHPLREEMLQESYLSQNQESVCAQFMGLDSNSVESWAEKLGTISYEVLTSLSPRISREMQ